jgi:hypothetical protein
VRGEVVNASFGFIFWRFLGLWLEKV